MHPRLSAITVVFAMSAFMPASAATHADTPVQTSSNVPASIRAQFPGVRLTRFEVLPAKTIRPNAGLCSTLYSQQSIQPNTVQQLSYYADQTLVNPVFILVTDPNGQQQNRSVPSLLQGDTGSTFMPSQNQLWDYWYPTVANDSATSQIYDMRVCNLP